MAETHTRSAVGGAGRCTLFDVNALVALCLTTHQHHRAAHGFLARVADAGWATCPITEAALFRLLLNPAVTGRALSAADIAAMIGGFRTDDRWSFLPDATTLAAPLVNTTVLMGHQQVTDLHLVNLAARSGAVLTTFDASMASWLAPTDRQHVVVIPG